MDAVLEQVQTTTTKTIKVKEKKPSNSLKPIVIILSIMMLILAGALGFLLYNYFTDWKIAKMKSIELETTVTTQLNEINLLKSKVDSLQKNGGIPIVIADSLNGVISNLQGELETAKKQRVVYSSGGGKTKEINALKEQVKGYEDQLSKLNAELALLKGDKEKLNADLTTLNTEKNEWAVKNKSLEDKLTEAAILSASNILMRPYKLNKKGEKLDEEKSKKVKGLEISFTIPENKAAEDGERTIFIVLKGNNKKVISESTNNIFQFNGVDKVYTLKKSFMYSKKAIEIMTEYEFGKEVKAGEYTAEIYLDNNMLGTAVAYIK